MTSKCTCLNPQVNCFSGQCSYCNKKIEKKITVEDLKPKNIIGTFCDKCSNVVCACINNSCECGNKTFTHRHSNLIECTSCNKIRILSACL